jgi:hypothetical protein
MRIPYRCVSKACRREIEFEISRMSGTFPNPTCECGSQMKRVYSAPAFTRLSEAEAAEHFGEFLPGRKTSGKTA